jgi:hypothetical protein
MKLAMTVHTEDAYDYAEVSLKAVKKVVPPDLTHHGLGNRCYGCAPWLLVNHAHFAEGFSSSHMKAG